MTSGGIRDDVRVHPRRAARPPVKEPAVDRRWGASHYDTRHP
jgi:hypothetical protein